MMPPFLLSATLHKIGTLTVQFESDVVRARNLASMLAQEIKFDKTSSIRIGTAVSELCRNIIEHAKGGTIEFYLAKKPENDGLVIIFRDKGPGIKHLEEIKNGTFKSLRGMGVGLAGSQRLMDDFDIVTAAGQGTEITAAKWLPSHVPELPDSVISDIQQAFAKIIERGDSSFVETINAQNSELVYLLRKLQERNEEIETINRELEETNRGVLALNRELEDKAIAIENAKLLAEQANRAKSDFLARMSHEIRTPMNAVLGFTELLLKTPQNKLQKQYTENVSTAGKALLSIINDILDFSKIEAGKLDLDIVETNLPELLNQTIDIFRYTSAKKGLELLLTVDPGIPDFILADPVRLKQILINLISNAIKFTEKGEVELKVEFADIDGEYGNFIFSVSDTGIGITPDQKQKLFKAFSQADGSTTRKFGGTGLGLVISNLLAAKMNSELLLDSEFGKGSTFHFDLKTTYKIQPSFNSKRIHYKNVLVLDSNPKVLKNIETLLNYWGVSCRLFTDTFRALEALKTGQFDLIIGRNKMPDMTESELTEKVRAILGSFRDLPGIVMLHNSLEEEQSDLSTVREVHFTRIMMPVDTDSLLNVLIKSSVEEIVTDADKPANVNLPADEPVQINTKKVILIAEDVEMNMLLAKILVKSVLPEVTFLEAKNGLEAIEMINENHVDMVLMDVQMPVMDGMEATRKIRLLELPEKRDLPVLALTAGALPEEKEKALEAGMNDFLAKPIDVEELKNIMHKYLRIG
jgi:two-component system sensor histidine kinase EvgS